MKLERRKSKFKFNYYLTIHKFSWGDTNGTNGIKWCLEIKILEQNHKIYDKINNLFF